MIQVVQQLQERTHQSHHDHGGLHSSKGAQQKHMRKQQAAHTRTSTGNRHDRTTCAEQATNKQQQAVTYEEHRHDHRPSLDPEEEHELYNT